LFAAEREALRQGFTPGHFSFNAEGGRCERCEGAGVEKLEMYFFEDVYAPCERCEGQRFKPEVLAVRYRGKTISEVLNMTVDDALAFFSGTPRLQERLHLLSSIGLGYLRLGQSATTLSGGEAQRLKIAAELVLTGDRRRQDRSEPRELMYIMDEPTTGLHMDDVKKLLAVLQKLVNAGNTLVVVEHNLDVIKSADWVIDLGPEGGDAGGQIVAEGRPEQVMKNAASVTGRCLAQILTTTSV
jgi:excinuclease ABC subunit A